jgi:LysR family glycine cleavage system transcriptional activator
MDELSSTTSLPSLGALRTFEAAARLLSFKLAARELHVTPTAVSHQMRQLEAHVGVVLFERRTRQVTLTHAGSQLYPSVREGFLALTRGVTALRPKAAASFVTLTSTMAFTSRWLVPRMAAFRAREPAIDLSFLASDQAIDLEAGTADLAIRYGGQPSPRLKSEPLLNDRHIAVASPRLELRSARDLRRHALIHYRWHVQNADTPTWARWFAKAGLSPAAVGGTLMFSDETHAVQATIAGQGVALLSRALIADELANGTLIHTFGPELAGATYQLVYRPQSLQNERIAKVRRWLLAEARRFACERRRLAACVRS